MRTGHRRINRKKRASVLAEIIVVLVMVTGK
ncbi:unnamed protein product [Enterobius vermicularis]|uniref:Prepilin-type N-terminal cleavage/methylation domain-containing protein n=1 Tax=Enterobius vermicularis TaxID=51028 RepID=A0A0N4VQ13_ENTVE|nr:unnamed protein product [Enterobius vermicularis]